MNFLTLCVETNGVVKADNAPVFTTPTAVTGQTGKLAEIVKYVQRANLNIQNEQPDWKFMVKQGTFVTTPADPEYTLANIVASVTDFQHIIPFNFSDCPHILGYQTSVGISDSQPIIYRQYEFFRGYLDRVAVTDGRPQFFTILPDRSLRLYPAPDVAYTLRFDYKRTPYELAANTNTPIIPDHHHWAIVADAVDLYCRSNSGAGEMLAMNTPMRLRAMAALRSEQIPTERFDYTQFYGG